MILSVELERLNASIPSVTAVKHLSPCNHHDLARLGGDNDISIHSRE